MYVTYRSAPTSIDVLVAFVILCLCVGVAQQPSCTSPISNGLYRNLFISNKLRPNFLPLLMHCLDLSMLCRVNSSNIGWYCHFKRTPFIGCHCLAARVQIHIKLVNLQKATSAQKRAVRYKLSASVWSEPSCRVRSYDSRPFRPEDTHSNTSGSVFCIFLIHNRVNNSAVQQGDQNWMNPPVTTNWRNALQTERTYARQNVYWEGGRMSRVSWWIKCSHQKSFHCPY